MMSLASSILASAAAESTSVSEAAPYLAGFLVVLVTLAALMGVCMAVSKILQALTPAPAAPAPVAKSAAPIAPVADDTVPPEVVAVIAAAVSTTLGGKPRILSIRPKNSSWSQAGRQQIQTSHNIR
ncbi:MAG: OadG family protein [Akkermansiaceae bacterium]|nr:OadG family protein [Akkermansiaceae bacterium]